MLYYLSLIAKLLNLFRCVQKVYGVMKIYSKAKRLSKDMKQVYYYTARKYCKGKKTEDTTQVVTSSVTENMG